MAHQPGSHVLRNVAGVVGGASDRCCSTSCTAACSARAFARVLWQRNGAGRLTTGGRVVMACPRCKSVTVTKDGNTQLGGQRFRCSSCGRRFTRRSTSAFSGRAFPDDIIALAVRWYVRYRLSYADVSEWLAERGVLVDQSTIYRWVQRFLPLFGEVARNYRHPVGLDWRGGRLCSAAADPCLDLESTGRSRVIRRKIWGDRSYVGHVVVVSSITHADAREPLGIHLQ
jgi:transposase-like protein